MGGYRQGSGRSKSGYYRGIYCGSTYELCWVIYHLDHNIPFTRFATVLEHDGVKYVPDFLLNDGKTIIETKGYEPQESVNRKSKVAEHYGYTVIVLRKSDLEFAFSYVKEHYGVSDYYTLYDGYKPKYDYVCSNCKKSYSSDKKFITKEVFCGRSCAGKFRKKKNQTVKKDAGSVKYVRKFDKETALEIYNRTDKSLSELAIEYGVTRNAIWFIKDKRTYSWIHT